MLSVTRLGVLDQQLPATGQKDFSPNRNCAEKAGHSERWRTPHSLVRTAPRRKLTLKTSSRTPFRCGRASTASTFQFRVTRTKRLSITLGNLMRTVKALQFRQALGRPRWLSGNNRGEQTVILCKVRCGWTAVSFTVP